MKRPDPPKPPEPRRIREPGMNPIMIIIAIITITALVFLTCCARKPINLPRFVIYEDVFVYRNHERGETIYIKIK